MFRIIIYSNRFISSILMHKILPHVLYFNIFLFIIILDYKNNIASPLGGPGSILSAGKVRRALSSERTPAQSRFVWNSKTDTKTSDQLGRMRIFVEVRNGCDMAATLHRN